MLGKRSKFKKQVGSNIFQKVKTRLFWHELLKSHAVIKVWWCLLRVSS